MDNVCKIVGLITTHGWNWIERNEEKFMLKRPPPKTAYDSEEIPF
jgi:hypothetical protein